VLGQQQDQNLTLCQTWQYLIARQQNAPLLFSKREQISVRLARLRDQRVMPGRAQAPPKADEHFIAQQAHGRLPPERETDDEAEKDRGYQPDDEDDPFPSLAQDDLATARIVGGDMLPAIRFRRQTRRRIGHDRSTMQKARSSPSPLAHTPVALGRHFRLQWPAMAFGSITRSLASVLLAS